MALLEYLNRGKMDWLTGFSNINAARKPDDPGLSGWFWNWIIPKLVTSSSSSKPHPEEPEKILVICLSETEHVIRSLPIVQLIKRSYPSSYIALLVNEISKPLLVEHPDINELMYYNAPGKYKNYESYVTPSKSGILNLIWDIRRKQFDTVMCLDADLRSMTITGFSGASTRIGYHLNTRPGLLTSILEYNTSLMEMQNHLNLLRPLNISPFYIAPQIIPSESDLTSTRAILSGFPLCATPMVICPGYTTEEYHWTVENYKDFIDICINSELCVLMLGGPNDRILIDRIRSNIDSDRFQIWNFPTLGEIAALAGFTSVYLGAWSDPSHIMAAMGTPSIIIGSKVMALDPPLGLHTNVCHPSRVCDCSERKTYLEPPPGCKCIQMVSVSDVVDCVNTISAGRIHLE